MHHIEVRITQGHAAPSPTAEVHVVVDVLRAFTVAAVAFAGGARSIQMVGTAAAAFALKAKAPGLLLVGEIGGLPIRGFDYGNSPAALQAVDLRDRALVLRTTNGVQALLAARGARHVLACGLLNVLATAAYIRALGAREVVVVASHPHDDDDLAVAEHLADLLDGGGRTRLVQVRERILSSAAAEKFRRDPTRFNPADLVCAVAGPAAPFAMVLDDAGHHLTACRLPESGDF